MKSPETSKVEESEKMVKCGQCSTKFVTIYHLPGQHYLGERYRATEPRIKKGISKS